jgi:winged helix DNA-binding protein
MTGEKRVRQRATAQLLGPGAAGSPAAVVERVIGVQAQDVRAARLAVRARSDGLTAADVDRACDRGELVRTWLMRSTLHMARAGDIRWLLRIFGERNARAGRGRRQRLGVDEQICDRALAALPQILGGGPALRRDDLVEALRGHGVDLDPRSQAPAHLLLYAASHGIVCRGPETETDEPTYALLDDVLAGSGDPDDGTGASPDDDLARLAARYVAGYGPVAPEDLAAWSGLPVTVARSALATVADDAPPAAERGRTRLLGHFDTYLLGYAGRAAAVPPEYDSRLQSGGGFVMPAVSVGGRVVGTWTSRRRGGRITVEATPFEGDFPAPVRRALPGEVADVGRFLRVGAELV